MADQQSGSFSDLYEVMQQRRSAPAVGRSSHQAPSPTPATPVQDKTSNRREVGKEGSRELGKETSQPASGQRQKPAVNLNERAYRKDSFMFTDAEFHALDQLKLDLRSKHELPATKNDLARCAIGHMLRDYQDRGNESFVVGLLKTKGSR